MLASFVSGEFLLNIPSCLDFMWGDSLTHPKLTLFLFGEFVLHIQCYFVFMRGVSLTLPVLPSFVCLFYLGSFSYTFRTAFFYLSG